MDAAYVASQSLTKKTFCLCIYFKCWKAANKQLLTYLLVIAAFLLVFLLGDTRNRISTIGIPSAGTYLSFRR